MRTTSDWNGSLSPRLLTTILVGLLTGTLLASASILTFPSQSFSVGDVNLAAADTIRGTGSYRLASWPALSGDGSTVIFGEQGHFADWAIRHRATVQVREWNGSSWVSKGSLPDANNREIGFWQDISDNGDVVSYSTHVLEKVFVADWSGSAWVQRPTITASQAGVSLGKHSLSGDGNVLVVGESGFDNGVEIDNGKVRTLDWDGSSWRERTAIIGAEGESLGNSRMDITADGATISFGGSLYSNADGAEVGRVRVATWDGASWAERPALTGSQASARASNPVLSDDGAVLGFSEAEWAVSGRIRTFDWRESSWIERPRVADGSYFWNDVDISASGTAIAMSSYGNQKLRVYDWVGDSWVQRGSDAPTFDPGVGGHYGYVASMSSNGMSVATSQIYSDINGRHSGRVDIYRSPGALRGVVFDSNGGSGAMSTQTNHNSAALSSSSFSKTGATFSGWNTVADGSGTDYGDGDTYDFSANVTLYAQWRIIPPPPSAESESANTLLIDPDPAPVTARGRAALLPEPDRPLKTAPVVIQRIQQSSGSSQPAAAIALVGGEEVAVKATTRGSQAARYGVGKVTVDVGVAAKDGAVDSVGGVPSLKIVKNSAASVKGAGLQPNSTMQVFLPASNGSFIELPPVAVASDGSFDGSLPLRTSGRSMPMPIGKNSIQMVGVDDEGNETVLDIPVTIAQPLPAPEINRISGERPALTPGQGLALNAGSPETVTLKRSSAATSVEGEDWAVTVAGATIDSTGQTLAFTRDAPVAYSGEGFMPGTRADVWLFSDPTLVGTVDIAEDGTFTASFAVDSNFVPTGDHTLQIQGVGKDGFVRAANLGVVVEDPVSTPLAPIDSDPIGWVPLMIIGTSVGGLLVLVGVTLAIRRGKRAKERLVPISL